MCVYIYINIHTHLNLYICDRITDESDWYISIYDLLIKRLNTVGPDSDKRIRYC